MQIHRQGPESTFTIVLIVLCFCRRQTCADCEMCDAMKRRGGPDARRHGFLERYGQWADRVHAVLTVFSKLAS